MGQKSDAGKDFQRRGYQPLNTGYSPGDQRANSPQGNDLPKAPAGRRVSRRLAATPIDRRIELSARSLSLSLSLYQIRVKACCWVWFGAAAGHRSFGLQPVAQSAVAVWPASG